MVRGLAALFAAGATLVALTVAVPHAHEGNAGWLLIPAGVAYVVAAALWTVGSRIGEAPVHVTMALGSLLVALCVVLADEAGGAYAFMFVWVGGYTAAFFGARATAAHLAWAGALYAAALAISGDVEPPAAQWLMALGTSAVAAVLIHELSRQVRARTRDLAALADLATQLSGEEEVSAERAAAAVCEAMLHSARADAVVLLETLPDQTSLHVLGMAGSADDAPLLDAPAGIAALDLANTSGKPVRIHDADHRRIQGLVHPVQRQGRPAGLLALVWRRPLRRLADRVAEAAALFAGEAGVAMERVERQTLERERRALELNDEIVQGLVVAKYAIHDGRLRVGEQAIDQTLSRAKALVTGQLESLGSEALRAGSLRRRRVG